MQPVEFREPSGLVVILRTSQERLILHCVTGQRTQIPVSSLRHSEDT